MQSCSTSPLWAGRTSPRSAPAWYTLDRWRRAWDSRRDAGLASPHLRFGRRDAMRPRTLAAATVAMVALGHLSCDSSPMAPRLDQLSLDVVSGDGQTGVVGTEL